MHRGTLIRYTVAGLIVVMLGALAGWYIFVRGQIAHTTATDTARGFGSIASFGSDTGGTYDNISEGEGVAGQSAQRGTPAPRLWKITTTPVSGLGFAATSSRLYFVERATGNILIANPSDSSVTRLTNTLFPKIYDAQFTGNGSVVLRFLSSEGEPEGFAGIIATSSSTSSPSGLLGKKLPTGVTAVAVRSDSPQLFFLARTSGGLVGATAGWSLSDQKQVFTSALSGWQPLFLSDGKIYVTQNPSDDVPGYAFSIGGNGSLTEILPGLPGLTVLPKASSSALLYGTSQAGRLTLFVQSGAQSTAVQLPIRTIADKCAWAPDATLSAYCAVPVSGTQGRFLDEWYMGAAHTTDAWWRIEAVAGTAERFFTTDSSLALDVERPVVDASGSYIAFINRQDGTLWMLRITQ